MPVEESNEKVHNFFEQGNLPQGGQQSQCTGGNWSVLNSNLWQNNQRQGALYQYSHVNCGHPFDSGKVSENSRGLHTSPTPLAPFSQQSLKDHFRNLNGILQVPQGIVSKSHQAGSLGEDSTPDRNDSALRNIVRIESQEVSENVSVHTRISKSVETAESPVNFDFLGSQHQLMRGQQPGMSQSQTRPLPGFSDMKLLQQQYFYNQLQEIRQRQLQQLEQEPRRQNSVQFSSLAKQASGDHATTVVNGTPMHDASNCMWSGERAPQMGGDPKMLNSSSQGFMFGNTNMVQTGGSALQGFPNALALSQDQTRAFNSMGLVPQQLDQPTCSASLGGIREASSNRMNAFPNLQWGAPDSADIFTKPPGNQFQKTVMQSNAFGSFYGDQSASFSGHANVNDGLSVSKQNFHGKSVLSQVPNAVQSVNSGIRPGNFQQGSSLIRNMPMQEFQGRQEHVSWVGNVEEKITSPTAPPQGVATLDPFKEKILYGGDNCGWDTAHGGQPLLHAFGRAGGMSAGSFLQGNQLEGSDYFNMFPNVQSGSWSALMQSAVAEASSSDTGMQDEWSGLSFQKAELSTGNPSELNDNGRQGAGWGEPSTQTANSLSSRPFHLFDDVNMSSGGQTVGFQQMTAKLTYDQNGQAESEVHSGQGFLHNDDSSEALRRSPKDGGWLAQNPKERAIVGGGFQTPLSLGNSSGGAWRSQTYGQPESIRPEDMGLNAPSMQSAWTHQRQPSVLTYRTGWQPSSKLNCWNMNESLPSDGDNLQQDDENNLQTSHSNESMVAMHLGRGHDANLWQADDGGTMQTTDNQGLLSIPNLSGRLVQAKSPSESPKVQNDGACVNSIPCSRVADFDLEKKQQLPNSNHFDPSSSSNMRAENVDKYQLHLNQGSSINYAGKVGESHESNREKCYLSETPTNGLASNHFYPVQQATVGGVLMDNTWLAVKDSPALATGNQKSSVHVAGKINTAGPRKFLYHPMGELAIHGSHLGTLKHDMVSEGLQCAASREQKNLELGYMAHTQSAGAAVANIAANSGKGFLERNLQNGGKGLDGASSKAVAHGYGSSPPSLDAPTDFYPPKDKYETSQNMLELINKVDRSRENSAKPFGSSQYSPSLDASEAVTSGSTAGHMRINQLSSSQGFGLHLAPPSSTSVVPNHVFPSRHVNCDNFSDIEMEAGKGQIWLAGQTSTWSLPHSSETSQRAYWSNKTAVTDTGHEFSPMISRDTNRLQSNKILVATAGTHYIQNQLQSQQNSGASGQAIGEDAADLAYAGQLDPDKLGKSESSFRQIRDSQDGRSVELLVQTLQAETAGKVASFDLNPRRDADITDLSGPSFVAGSNTVANAHLLPSTSANSSHTGNSNQLVQTLESAPVSQVSGQQGVQQSSFSTMLHNVWLNMSAQRSMSGVPQMVSRGPIQSINPATTWVVQALNDKNLRDRGGSSASELCPGSTNVQHFPPGGDHQSRESPSQRIPSNRASSSESVEHEHLTGSPIHQKKGREGNENSVPSKTSNMPFQRTLDSAAGSQSNYSLLHQMQAMKSAESDPNKALKRLRGENDSDVSHVAAKIGQKHVYGYGASNSNLLGNSSRTLQHAPYPVSESKRLSFTLEETKSNNANASSHILSTNTHQQDVAAVDRNKSQNYPLNHFTLTPPQPSLREPGHSHPNTQMANSWFEQFGTYKNGQFVTMSDRFAVPQNSATAAAQQFFFGRISESTRPHAVVEQRSFSDVNQVGSVTSMPSSTSVAAAKELPSPLRSSWPDASGQTQVIMKAKKRKSASLERLPWNKVVTHTSRSLRSISFAELRWAHAMNRRTEKIDDEAEVIDDGLLTPGPRRRLIFTTQLMQQIVCPLSATLLSADASSEYETATYILAKLSLGDACSLVSSLAASSQVNNEKDNKTSVKTGSFGRLGIHFLSKLVEGFLDKVRTMENDFLRLEKGPSVLDIRVECQDLERFSIINRFARIHGRGPAEGAVTADTSTSAPTAAPSSDAIALMPRKFPQRYVTAVPMPRNLPEGLQCHSL